MKGNQTKLISAAMTLLLSVVMLTMASFAWFTISTAPEITGMQVSLYTDLDLLVSKTADGTFTQSVSTAQQEKPTKNATIDDLQFYLPLRPVSTVDGLDWYRATYNEEPGEGIINGSLKDVQEFDLLDEDVHANVVLWEWDEANQVYTKPMSDTSQTYILREREGYYMYADVWLKTENEDGVCVTLSVPNITAGQDHDNGLMQKWELGKDNSQFSKDHGKKYGSYALSKYVGSGANVYTIDNNVQTALRVGFRNEQGKFIVWEPNADQRSDATYKPKKGDTKEPAYIKGYELLPDKSNYNEGDYIPTHPIGTVDGVPAVVDMPWDRLLVQRGCSWNEESVKKNFPNLTSADVYSFGQFITDNTKLSKTNATDMDTLTQYHGLASSNIITTLRKDVPQKVRIYFWLEGQDVDCWNDIASGSFIVNLEFAAQPLKEPLPPAPTVPTENPEPAP